MVISKKIENLVDNCDENHYLKFSKLNTKKYYNSFVDIVMNISKVLSPKKLDDLLENKILLKQSFEEFVYLQSATELTINSYFCNLSPSTFKYEAQVNPHNKKDVDCQVEIDGIKFNIEIKCPDLNEKLKMPNDILHVSMGTRIPDYKNVQQDISKLTASIIDSPKSNYQKAKNVKRDDNKMKDYLIEAHKKFIDGEDLNILFVPLNTVESFDEWLAYLIEPNAGLFTDKSYISVQNFNKVDLVVFSNLINSHLYYNTTPISNPWDFSLHFNIVQCNPNRLRDKKNAIFKFYQNLIPNYSDEFTQHFKKLDFISQTTGVKSFVIEYIEKKLGLDFFN